jgi:hypothetical protein
MGIVTGNAGRRGATAIQAESARLTAADDRQREASRREGMGHVSR